MTAELNPTSESSESTWSSEDLDLVRAELVHSVARLQSELLLVDSDLTPLAAHTTLDILHDELDVAAQRDALLQDAVQAENTAAILAQTQHVLARLDAGLYGVCEGCSGQVGRPRLEAFPRATLCMSCVR